MRKPTLVRARTIDRVQRVACAMHHTLDTDEGLWIMVPIDDEQAVELEGVTLEMRDPDKDVTHRIDPRL